MATTEQELLVEQILEIVELDKQSTKKQTIELAEHVASFYQLIEQDEQNEISN